MDACWRSPDERATAAGRGRRRDRRRLRLHLEEAGYRLHRESDGLQAMAAIDRQRWDMVLLDLMLPGADGWDVCRHLRARHADVPVIMLSARSAEAHRVLGLNWAPTTTSPSRSRCSNWWRACAPCCGASSNCARRRRWRRSLRFGPFRLDTVRRELLRGDEAVPLTLREFDLLHFLARHPGRAFSRGELLQRVWGAAFDGYEHTVNSHINRLRTKIEDDPRDPRRIVTVWGVGYRFEDKSACPVAVPSPLA
jgi:DNA-binding response OmpR family regulator